MRGLTFLLLIIAIIGTALGAVGIAYGIVEREAWMITPSLALIILPWIGWAVARVRTTNEGRAAFDAALAAGFRADKQQWFKGSGLAIDTAAGKLLVASRDSVAVHPVADLKAVLFVPESAGSVSAAGMSGMGIFGVVLALLAIGSATAGHLTSGLFITLSGNPVRSWQIFGISKADAEAWIERLRAAAPDMVVKETR